LHCNSEFKTEAQAVICGIGKDADDSFKSFYISLQKLARKNIDKARKFCEDFEDYNSGKTLVFSKS
jgi:hypothetical protein